MLRKGNGEIFLVLLNYREIITVKTVTLYKKLFSFIKSLKTKKKEAGTNFVSLCQLRNMVGQFKKTYSH